MSRADFHRLISLHAASSEAVSLCAAMTLPASAEPPEWVQLLPAGEIRTRDGRGPYRVRDVAALIRESLHRMEGRGVLDENHATDLAAPRGETAPARGWIVALEGRASGVWGKVDWTPPGKRLMRHRSYRGVSPVIEHDAAGNVTAILRASLINTPNLLGLAALHQEKTMDFITKLRKALGLADDASEDAILAAIGTAKTALQGALDPIAAAVGLQAGADAAAVLAGVTNLGKAKGDADVIAALQGEIADLGGRLKTLTDKTATEKATAFVDAAIVAGTVGVKPLRDHYIARHAIDPAGVEKEIGALPKLGATAFTLQAPPAKDGEIALQAEDLAVAKALGLDPKDYAATLKAERPTAL